MPLTPNQQTVSIEELAYLNMLRLNALIELLDEKGLIRKQEVRERVSRLRTKTAGKRKRQ